MNYTGSDCLEQLRNGSFSWRYFVPDSPSGRNTPPRELSQSVSSTITENEETQAQSSKPSCLLLSPSTQRPPVARSKRARTKRCRRSSFSPRRSFPVMCEPKNSSTSRIVKKRKIMVQLRPTHPMEKEDGSTKCTHCGVTDTPQWRAGPLGPRTLCNACGVRYKSGRLLPEYRPAASPYFSPTLHSNSHRKVLQMRNKLDHVGNSGTQSATETELARPNIPEKAHWIRNKADHERYNEETIDNTPVASSESELIPSFGSNSHESVLQMRDDEEEFYGYCSNEIDTDSPMELIPNIDPLYGLDLSEYYLGNHSLDFTY